MNLMDAFYFMMVVLSLCGITISLVWVIVAIAQAIIQRKKGNCEKKG